MVEKATLGVNSNQQIIGEVTKNLNDAVLTQFPKLNTIQRKLR